VISAQTKKQNADSKTILKAEIINFKLKDFVIWIQPLPVSTFPDEVT
jgi:hypothetical protein